MRTKIMIALLLVILTILNYGIYKNEQIKRHGEAVFLKVQLHPVSTTTPGITEIIFGFIDRFDMPASNKSIFGEKITLSYSLADNLLQKEKEPSTQRGYIVINAPAYNDNVAQFIRFYRGEPSATGEKLLRYTLTRKWEWDVDLKNGIYRPEVLIEPNRFFVPPGHYKDYEKRVRYAVFKFNAAGKYLLVGLADENRHLITPL